MAGAALMAVYVDNMATPYRGMRMSHMLADRIEELHAMADQLGLRREWFQPASTPHYDICQAKRRRAISLGAVEVGRREVAVICRRWREGRS